MKRILYLASLMALILYFAFFAFLGERGWFALQDLRLQEAVLEQQLETLQSRRQALEAQVQLLRPESLDPDMLDERIRFMLGYAAPDERILILSAQER